MCRSMVDIQSATTEIRRGKKRRKKRKKHDKNIMSASAMQSGHKKKCKTKAIYQHYSYSTIAVATELYTVTQKTSHFDLL